MIYCILVKCETKQARKSGKGSWDGLYSKGRAGKTTKQSLKNNTTEFSEPFFMFRAKSLVHVE